MRAPNVSFVLSERSESDYSDLAGQFPIVFGRISPTCLTMKDDLFLSNLMSSETNSETLIVSHTDPSRAWKRRVGSFNTQNRLGISDNSHPNATAARRVFIMPLFRLQHRCMQLLSR